MATNDPKTRLEGSLNSPSYTAPNGVTEQRGDLGATSGETGTPRSDVGRRPDESPGEKIGRFFRKAMDRISGHDEDAWRQGNDRNQRDRDTQERYRAGDRSWQYGRSALRERGQNEWSDLGHSRDDRNASYRGGPSSDTGGSYERLQSGMKGGHEREDSSARQGPSFEKRSGQSFGQRGLGRSPSEGYGLSGVPDERPIGSDRGFAGDQGRDDWNRRDWTRSEPYRERSASERNAQSGA